MIPMTDKNDIDKLAQFMKVAGVISRISRVSYLADQARKRYTDPEYMTTEEIEALTRLYLALGYDFEQAYKDWKKVYAEYRKKTKTIK